MNRRSSPGEKGNRFPMLVEGEKPGRLRGPVIFFLGLLLFSFGDPVNVSITHNQTTIIMRVIQLSLELKTYPQNWKKKQKTEQENEKELIPTAIKIQKNWNKKNRNQK